MFWVTPKLFSPLNVKFCTKNAFERKKSGFPIDFSICNSCNFFAELNISNCTLCVRFLFKTIHFLTPLRAKVLHRICQLCFEKGDYLFLVSDAERIINFKTRLSTNSRQACFNQDRKWNNVSFSEPYRVVSFSNYINVELKFCILLGKIINSSKLFLSKNSQFYPNHWQCLLKCFPLFKASNVQKLLVFLTVDFIK